MPHIVGDACVLCKFTDCVEVCPVDAVHEAALAAFGVAPFVFPKKRVHLQYTTTSPKLHKVLGVESPVFD